MNLRQITVFLTFACLSTNQVAAHAVAGERASMTRYRQDFIASCTPTMPTTTKGISAKSMCSCMVDRVLVDHIKAHRPAADLPPLIGQIGITKKIVTKRIPFFKMNCATLPHCPQRDACAANSEPQTKNLVPMIIMSHSFYHE